MIYTAAVLLLQTLNYSATDVGDICYINASRPVIYTGVIHVPVVLVSKYLDSRMAMLIVPPLLTVKLLVPVTFC